MSIVTLTTDFGQRDGYVGTMKGVILGISPDATLVDISHGITPQNIAEAAFIVGATYRYFPRDTVHLVVVDPGVGTDRRPMALQTQRGIFVAPDNGVLSYVMSREESWSATHLTEPDYWLPRISSTFHGRDIFAPVAAHLARGTPAEKLGAPLRSPLMRELPQVKILDSTRLQASVLHIDHFGNVVTSLPVDMLVAGQTIHDLKRRIYVQISGQTIRGLRTTYNNVPEGDSLLLVGSSGFVEIARNRESAVDLLDIHMGDTIIFKIAPGITASDTRSESESTKEG